MRIVLTLGAVAWVVAVLVVLTIGRGQPTTAGPPGEPSRYADLEGDASWLVAHYDDRAGVFNDGADVHLSGKLPAHKFSGLPTIGEFTVDASAAWDWTVYASGHPSALIYNTPVTMAQDHQHANCRIVGSGTHTFTATMTIDTERGDINADILGGANNERLVFPSSGHVPICTDIPDGTVIGDSPPAYDGTHNETENEVLINFVITGGTEDFDGIEGRGVLQFVYNTMEPHDLLEASIILNGLDIVP